ncbi:LOW QUALITY PROTEIN: methyl-CpG-binding domain protein 1-like [Melanerpes formicivorus]|uniref:LOW QUALITY PROTEIN: methyl-CpG-binding domain protein 1-like n=1 Tax=Melanerpes formicivorus TaxID=211600 RepID=UPI00358F8922
MTEGWVECPALGPGWKRKETARKSGATCGRTDTYYQSPTGERFRSKVELSRFLGASRDLSNFDFKHGLELQRPHKPRKGPKWPPLTPPPLVEGVVKVEEAPPPPAWASPTLAEAPPHIKAEATPLPICPPLPLPGEAPPLPAEAPPPRRTRKRTPQAPPHGGVVACCANCQSLFPGVTLAQPRRCRWLCPDCRARRREFNRQQRFYKRIGCGSCQACKLPSDCGLCSVCSRRGTNQGPGSDHALANKCLLRRCLRIVKKTLGCGSCTGCRATEDCGCCYICLRAAAARPAAPVALPAAALPATQDKGAEESPKGEPSKVMVKVEADSGGVQKGPAPHSGGPHPAAPPLCTARAWPPPGGPSSEAAGGLHPTPEPEPPWAPPQ